MGTGGENLIKTNIKSLLAEAEEYSGQFIKVNVDTIKDLCNAMLKCIDRNEELEKMLEWAKEEEEEAGQKADEVYEKGHQSAYIRYNYVWASFEKVRKRLEKILQGGDL